MTLALNIILGLIPTFALAWSIAADERKPSGERTVASDRDRHQQRVMFLLVYGLWALTLAMWNWMRGASFLWIVVWSLLGLTALIACAASRK